MSAASPRKTAWFRAYAFPVAALDRNGSAQLDQGFHAVIAALCRMFAQTLQLRVRNLSGEVEAHRLDADVEGPDVPCEELCAQMPTAGKPSASRTLADNPTAWISVRLAENVRGGSHLVCAISITCRN